jgi:hypothetical protein
LPDFYETKKKKQNLQTGQQKGRQKKLATTALWPPPLLAGPLVLETETELSTPLHQEG